MFDKDVYCIENENILRCAFTYGRLLVVAHTIDQMCIAHSCIWYYYSSFVLSRTSRCIWHYIKQIMTFLFLSTKLHTTDVLMLCIALYCFVYNECSFIKRKLLLHVCASLSECSDGAFAIARGAYLNFSIL